MEKLKKLKPLTLALILIFAVAAEIFMSNYNYFAFAKGAEVKNHRPEGMAENIEIFKENDFFIVENLGFEATSLTFDVRSQSEATAFRTDIYYRQTAQQDSYSYLCGAEAYADVDGERVTLFFSSSGACDSLYVAFSEYGEPLSVSEITVNGDYEFSFGFSRFSVLFALLALVYIFCKTEYFAYLKKMSYKDAAFWAVALSLIATMMVSLLNFSESGALTPYPLEGGARYYNPYFQQFDALQKGQLHLDVEPSKALMELENPYDPLAREGVDYMWDRAFFNGKYYSYFGMTPIITVIYPVFLLLGALPSLTFVMSVFSAMASVFFALAVMEWSKLRKARSSPAFVSLCAVFAFLASQTLLMQRGNAQFYYVAGLTAMAFVSAFMFWMLKAIGSEKAGKRLAFYALAGISFGFAFHARVNTVLPFAVISAVFVIMLMIKRIKEKKTAVFALEALALGAPVMVAVLISFYLNYARFGNPLDFGTDYQLTVADTSLYRLNVAGIIPSIYHYFIQSFDYMHEFPFVDFNYVNLGNYGGYVYVDSGLGIFAYPFTLMLLLSPLAFRSKRLSRENKILLLAAIASLFVTAFADFCLGGVIFRYTADISLLAAFLSAVVALEACECLWDKHGQGAAKMLKYGIASLGAATVFVTAASMLICHTNTLDYSPSIFAAIKDFFVFW